ncbi:unknown protein [Bathycoccus prasinos]|uniref:Uncharacterized protein n=1 Tax=Bathycoccus prasinos TaxID=41875 RepID=K8E8Z1_9CHLO|nr:unknown protein [Bathycoccus prasinos]CCO14086.1 unknown protein [Bathycoccus prasinos]|eukprot:XP_007515207.1 unknown protein [Bathycoccus prasinos]
MMMICGGGDIAVVDCDDDDDETTPAAFLRRIETPCAYTAMRCEFMNNNGEKGTVAIERIDFHAKRVFASLSEEKRTGCLFENHWQKCRDALEKVTRTAFLKRQNAGFKKGRYMATIAIEDDRDEKKMNVHALLTPLITTRKDEKKGDEEVTALDRYALLRGAPRERPHAKHTEWVKKREGLEIERNEWNAREDVKETRRKRTFVECVLSKRTTGSGSALQEEDFQICEGLTTNVFVLKRDDAHSNGGSRGGLILQTAPDADVLLGVARRAILDAFPSSKNDSEEDENCKDAKIRLSLTHPLWSERETWIALFTVNCVVGAKLYHGIVNSYTGEEVNFPPLPIIKESGVEGREKGLSFLFRTAFSSSSQKSSFPFDLFE